MMYSGKKFLKTTGCILILAFLTVAGCARPHGKKPAEGAPGRVYDEDAPLRVSFRVNFFPVQKALWIEDAGGGYVRTLHVSRWLAGYGQEYGVLTDWVNSFGSVRGRKTSEQVDAFTQATLRAGEQKVFYSWDLTDWTGEKVPEGFYSIILQCDGAEGVVVTWKTSLEIGDEPVRALLSPEPSELPQGLEMYLEDVSVSYKPL
jgi:hypothetical protein